MENEIMVLYHYLMLFASSLFRCSLLCCVMCRVENCKGGFKIKKKKKKNGDILLVMSM